MKGALIILLITVVAGIALYLNELRYRKRKHAGGEGDDGSALEETGEADSTTLSETSRNPDGAMSEPVSSDGRSDGSECCGLHLICENGSSVADNGRIVYYDDEELDRYRERTPESYSGEETEEFRDVLMTMLPSDVPGWAHSLDRRGIRPPQEIRDEILMIVAEIAGDQEPRRK